MYLSRPGRAHSAHPARFWTHSDSFNKENEEQTQYLPPPYSTVSSAAWSGPREPELRKHLFQS